MIIAYPLVTHSDERGFFREVFRDDYLGAFHVAQVSHSRVLSGVVKGWHLHATQMDLWYVARGTIRAAFCDTRHGRFDVCTRTLGDDQEASAVRIPPGVAHGYVAISDAEVIYMTSHTYDPADELRIELDDTRIPYDLRTGRER